ncbi:C-type lectin domain family 4 member M-like [Podarcis raffonei]|uniref:C-type lectin domain family 4 member M-like n=1 Tax=Podarcis raffonei TaxID=65483 RepID=UPI0023292977|nr:C-type lectin domain family 4 member M-like [Podarcis raffonei]
MNSPTGEYIIISVIIALTVLTLLIFLLYQKEVKKRDEFQMAMDMIRTFVVGLDSIHEDKDDFQILAVAQNISEEMRYFANRNDELQKEIDHLIGNLNDGWVIYQRTFYFFSHEQHSWLDSKKECEREGAKLISFETLEEQQFVNKQVKDRKRWFWIGLFKDNGVTWTWLSGIVASITYWNAGEPRPGNCGALTFECGSNCWIASHCGKHIRYICKKVPNDVWL